MLKKLLKILGIFLLLLAVGLVLFFVFSGPEKVVRRVIQSQAAKAGLPNFSAGRIDISPGGAFSLEDLSLGGPIVAASPSVRNVTLDAGRIRGQIDWSRLFGGGPARPEGELPPLSESLPGILAGLEVEHANLVVDPTAGGRLRIENLNVTTSRPGGRLQLDASVGRIEWSSPEAATLAENLQLNGNLGEHDIHDLSLSADTRWGPLQVSGQVQDVSALLDEIAEARRVLSATAATGPRDVARALEGFNRSGLDLSGAFQRIQGASPVQLGEPFELDVPEGVTFSAKTGDQGLRLATIVSGGELRSPTVTIGWATAPLSLAAGRVQVGPAEPRITLRSATGTVELPLRVSGWADFNQPGAPFHVDAGTLHSIDAAALARAGFIPGVTPGQLSGRAGATLSADGTLQPFSLSSATASAPIDLRITPPGGQPLPVSGQFDAHLQDETLRISTDDFALLGGRLTLDATSALSQFSPQSWAADFSLSGVRPEPLAGILPFAATGTLSARGHLASASGLTDLDGQVHLSTELSDLVFGERSTGPLDASIEAHWTGRRLAVPRARIALLGGEVAGSGSWGGPGAPQSATVDARLHFPSVRALDRLAPELSAPIAGSLSGRVVGGGSWGAEPTGQLHVDVKSEGVGYEGRFEGGGLSLVADVTPRGATLEQLSLRSEKSEIAATGRVGAEGALNLDFHADIERGLLERYRSVWEKPSPVLADLSLARDGRLQLKGTATGSVTEPVVQGELSLREARFRDVIVKELTGRAHYADKVLEISDLAGRAVVPGSTGPPTRLSGGATVRFATPLSVEFHARAQPLNLDLLGPFVPETFAPQGLAEIEASGRYAGGIESLKARMSLPQLTLGGESARGLSLDAQLNGETFNLDARADELFGGSLVARGSGGAEGPVQLSAELKSIQAGKIPGATMVQGAFDATLTARLPGLAALLAPASEATRRALVASLRVESPSLTVRAADLADVVASVDVKNGGASLDATVADPDVHATGTLDLAGGAGELVARWQGLDIADVINTGTTAPQFTNTAGLTLTRSAEGALAARLESASAEIAWRGRRLVQEGDLRISFVNDQVNLERLIFTDPQLPGSRLQLSGGVDLSGATPQLDLTYNIEQVHLAAFNGLYPKLREIHGILSARGRVAGPASDPAILGDLSIAEGRLYVEGMPQALSDFDLSIVGTREGLRLERLSGLMGRGTVSASGSIELGGAGLPRLDLGLAFDHIRYAEVRDLSIEANGRLSVKGDLLTPLISGKVEVERGSYTRPFDATVGVPDVRATLPRSGRWRSIPASASRWSVRATSGCATRLSTRSWPPTDASWARWTARPSPAGAAWCAGCFASTSANSISCAPTHSSRRASRSSRTST